MAKDPAFLFYPGDYLRDTQCLSEAAQVAYDRIMCEHMRNICISQKQLNFFIKRLSPEEKEEVYSVLTKAHDGFEITWVAESIRKRKAYGESRRNNRKGKVKEDMNNISETYVQHMENEIENEIEVEIKRGSGGKIENQCADEEIRSEIMTGFNLQEYTHARLFSQLTGAINHLHNSGQLAIFKEQARAYLKVKTDPRYRHSLEKFLGPPGHFDGAWQSENWKEKLKPKGTSSNNGRSQTGGRNLM